MDADVREISAQPSGSAIDDELYDLEKSGDPEVKLLRMETATVELREGTRLRFFTQWLCGCNAVAVVSKDPANRSTIATFSHHPSAMVKAQIEELNREIPKHSPGSVAIGHDLVILAPGRYEKDSAGTRHLKAGKSQGVDQLLKTLRDAFASTVPTLIAYDERMVWGQSSGFVLDFPAEFDEPVRYDGRHRGQMAL